MFLKPGQAPTAHSEWIDQAEQILRARQSWSDEHAQSTASVAATLLGLIPADGFQLIGFSGAPGCGKSSLAELIAQLLEQNGTGSVVISLDNYYLSRSEREKLAHIHPLFLQRGVAGTHNWHRLIGDIDAIREGSIDQLRIPRFNKSDDDVFPPEQWASVQSQPRVVILEGWLIGALPQSNEELQAPVNQTESSRDSEATWRRAVNEWLFRYHRDLQSRITAFWFMSAPGWKQVIKWRWQQEKESSAKNDRSFLENREEVTAFLQPFQRTVNQMNQTCEQWADKIIDIDEYHHLALRPDKNRG